MNSIIADLRLKYTYNSNALEGNTLTIYETKVILENGVTIGGKSLRVAYAALAHAYLANIPPFVDGNGRTCRLIMNMELMKSGYPIVLIDVNDGAEYCRLLEFGDINNDYTQFIDFIADCTKKSLEIYLDAIEESN